MCAWEVILIRRSGGCGRCGRTGFGTASAAFHTVSGLRDSAHTQNTPTVTQPRSHGSTSTSTSTTDGAQLYPAPTAVQTVHRAVSRHRVRRANAPHQSHTRAQDAGGSSTLTPSHAHTGRQCVQRTTVWGKVTPQWTLPTHTHTHTHPAVHRILPPVADDCLCSGAVRCRRCAALRRTHAHATSSHADTRRAHVLLGGRARRRRRRPRTAKQRRH